MNRRLVSTLAALALACPACAQTGLPRPDEPIDREVGRLVRRVRGDKTVARVEQHGRTVTVRTTWTCNLEKVRVVDRTSLVPLEDDRTAPVVLVLVGGTMSLLGVVTLVIAVAANDGSSVRAAAIGGGLTGVGAGLLAGGLIVARRAPAAVSVMRVDLEDGLLQANVPCRDVPNALAREPVTGHAEGPPALDQLLGVTGDGGELEIDLTEVLPPSLLREAATGATMAIVVRGREVGTVRLDEAARAFEAEVWAHAGVETCATGSAEDACSGLERYLRELPSGAHAAEAREALQRGKATLPARIAAAARERAAQARAAAQRTAACRHLCKVSCKGAASCTEGCVAQSCR